MLASDSHRAFSPLSLLFHDIIVVSRVLVGAGRGVEANEADRSRWGHPRGRRYTAICDGAQRLLVLEQYWDEPFTRRCARYPHEC